MATGFLKGIREFCITDVGSTTTKAILFSHDDRGWTYQRREAPTTVEAPHEDVTVGVAEALSALCEATGVELLSDQRPAIPYLSTSSAGGGLAMIVTGLVREVTSRSAERVAIGAGSVLLDVIAMDDGRTPYEKIRALKQLRPDMVLLAGGFDGEAISGPVFLAELIRESGLTPKLNPSGNLPVVYAGNVNAAEFVKDTLGDEFMFHPIPNIRPSANLENCDPAREAIHGLFMNHVMSQAPGYGKLVDWVDSPVVPTPSAFGKILSVASAKMNKRIMAIDIGGATTDVFTAHHGEVVRTVSANLGMSYSIINVVRTAGIEAVWETLTEDLDEETLWDLLGNKFIRPTGLASSTTELRMEWATAAIAVREAVKEHLNVVAGVSINRGQDDLKIRRSFITETKKDQAERKRFSLNGYDLVIGSGGILSHSARETTAMIMIDALRPSDQVDLAVDSAFMFPHLGVLADEDPDLALQLFQELGLVRLGRFCPAYTKGKAKGIPLHCKGETSSGRQIDETISDHGVVAIPLAAGEEAELQLSTGLISRKNKIRCEGGVCGVMIDTRRLDQVTSPGAQRGNETTLFPPEPGLPKREVILPKRDRVRRGVITLRRELAIPGDVFVSRGERVKPDTVVARSNRQFRRPFFLNVADVLKVPPREVEPYLLKQVGDEIATEELIARRKVNRFSTKDYTSPVSGVLERILPSGTLFVREKAEDAKQLTIVNVAKDLRVYVEQIKPYLRVEPGQEIDRNQWVAAMVKPGDMRVSRSPVRGKIKEINLEYGIVTIEPLLEELAINAWLPGRVKQISDRGCLVENQGISIEGIWGQGGEVFGKLQLTEVSAESIMIRDVVSSDELRKFDEANITGLITGGLHLKDVLDINPGYTIVVVEGFGEQPLPEAIRQILHKNVGQTALSCGTTEMRVGVRRPQVILPES